MLVLDYFVHLHSIVLKFVIKSYGALVSKSNSKPCFLVSMFVPIFTLACISKLMMDHLSLPSSACGLTPAMNSWICPNYITLY